MFKTKVQKNKIDKTMEQILNLQGEKKELEIQREQMQLENSNMKRKAEMAVEEKNHTHKLELREKIAEFEREKKIWNLDKNDLIEKHDRESTELEKRLQAEFDIKEKETIALGKLENQQKTKQAELDSQREVAKIKEEYAIKESKLRIELAEENYKKLSEAMTKLHSEGNSSSKFIQEIALKMMDKGPNPNETNLNFTHNQPPKIAPPQTTESVQ